MRSWPPSGRTLVALGGRGPRLRTNDGCWPLRACRCSGRSSVKTISFEYEVKTSKVKKTESAIKKHALFTNFINKSSANFNVLLRTSKIASSQVVME